MTAESTQVQVRLRGVPLRLRARATEYDQDLLRELALVRLSADHDATTTAPDQLLDLADEVRSTYGGMTAAPEAAMDAALERGEDTLDVVYTVPVEVRSMLHRVESVLEAVDRYCRDGRYLLTLAAPTDVVAYRRWLFGEFHRQIDGEPPLPWPESAEAVSIGWGGSRVADDG